jgi:putative peptidoglycan lipid II flippase
MATSTKVASAPDGVPIDRPARSLRSRAPVLVAAGILLSRVVGLVRERVFGFYFGVTDEADAFRAAFRIQNLLQYLVVEGVLSASMIHAYSSLDADVQR